MTPERQKWWDSLPAEEKRVRKNIKSERKPIKAAKKALKVYHELNDYVYKKIIRENKQIIKALRKQIAMRVISDEWDDRYCPCCNNFVWRPEDGDYFGEPPKYCEDCGQKLRCDWQ